MIEGGIFSVLGIAVTLGGHAVPLSFVIDMLIALAAGYHYVRLALTFRDDGTSYTYLRRAWPSRPWIAGIEGWTVILGYVGTLALYAFTFGAYGADLLGSAGNPAVRIWLSAGLAFALLGRLSVIAEFSSMTFLLVSIGVSLANLKLRGQTGAKIRIALAGLVLMAITVVTILIYLAVTNPIELGMILALYLVVGGVALAYMRWSKVQASA